jgi:hypothetical protein
MLQHIATHSVTIRCLPDQLFEFIADLANWPKWSIATCETVKPLPEGCWLMHSMGGSGRLSVDANPVRRIAQFTIALPEGDWQLLCEVRAAEAGSAELLLTFPKPDHCDEACFDDYTHIAEQRLQRLKTLLDR